jgi:hypothetical protein
MVFTRTSRRTLLALALAVGLGALPTTGLEARPFSRSQTRAEPRGQEASPLARLWSFLASLWGDDGSAADPFGVKR